jgi:hypothetical protein
MPIGWWQADVNLGRDPEALALNADEERVYVAD